MNTNMRFTPTASLTVAVACAIALTACNDAPPAKPPAPPVAAPSKPTPAPNASAPSGALPNIPEHAGLDPSSWKTSGPNDDPKVMAVAGLTAPKPATWAWQQPTMQFRTLQYSVPGEGAGAGNAELIVSVFAGNDGGPTEGNIARWVNQFKTADGGAVTPKQTEKTVDGMKVILVELKGSYSGMGAAGPKPEQAQLGAIIEAPGRRVFLRLLGPDAIVEHERANWDKLVEGIRQSK